jgi:hypothetical protein
MKVYIGDYKTPYSVYSFEKMLSKFVNEDKAFETLSKLGRKDSVKRVFDGINKMIGDRDINVRIDKYDHWNAFETLAIVALPLLKELKKHKHGSPIVDDTDIPENLRLSDYKSDWGQSCFDFGDTDQYDDKTIHDKWNWVLDEIIWSFEQLNTDWEEQFYGTDCLFTSGYYEHSARIQNGLVLFGKYYQNLWD